MHEKLSGAALWMTSSWFVEPVRFIDAAAKVLTVDIDVAAGSRFAVDGAAGVYLVHDTVSKS
jgi:hypothetical protein